VAVGGVNRSSNGTAVGPLIERGTSARAARARARTRRPG
jgi:hypothetical protein